MPASSASFHEYSWSDVEDQDDQEYEDDQEYQDEDGQEYQENVSPQTLYTLGERIGDGTTAVVYKATHSFYGQVAVKKFYARYSFNAIREVELMRSVENHPQFMSVLDTWVDETNFCSYVAMELLDGDLLSLIEENSMSSKDMVECAYQLIKAVEYLHAKHIVHFDLKPENIGYIKQSNGSIQYKILDLGTAEMFSYVAKPSFQDSVNNGETVLSTIQYRSYEAIVLNGKHVHNEKSDIWSLGCIIYELMMGDQLFPIASENTIETNHSILEKGLQRVHKMSIQSSENQLLIQVMIKCLAKHPVTRYGAHDLYHFFMEEEMNQID